MHLPLCLLAILSWYELLEFDPGARAVSMATAGAEFSRTADAVCYNPAGAAFVKSLDVTFEHNLSGPWVGPFIPNYWSTALAAPLSGRFSVGALASGICYETSEWRPSAHHASVGLLGCYRPVSSIALGVNVKFNWSYFRYRSQEPPHWDTLIGRSLAADAGLQTDIPTSVGSLRCGLSLHNVGTLHSEQYGPYRSYDTLPYGWQANAGYALNIRQLLPRAERLIPDRLMSHRKWLLDVWNAELAYTVKKVGHEKLVRALGAEVKPLPVLAARIGYYYAPDEDTSRTRQGWTWGIGIDMKFLRADIARDGALFYDNYGYDKPRLRYSLAVNIGEPLLPEGGLLRR